MRLRAKVTTQATNLPWKSVLAPGRGIAYDLLRQADPALATQIHDSADLTPFGHGAPRFPKAKALRHTYATGGPGYVEFGSPLPEVLEAWALAMQNLELLDWGGTALRITGMTTIDPPAFAQGTAIIRTITPVVMKLSRIDQDGNSPWVLPTETAFASCLVGNLRRKATYLGLPADLELDAITWIGSKRIFAVGKGNRPGAPIEVRLSGDPRTLRAIWSWGLGQSNSAGFGWIGDPR